MQSACPCPGLAAAPLFLWEVVPWEAVGPGPGGGVSAGPGLCRQRGGYMWGGDGKKRAPALRAPVVWVGRAWVLGSGVWEGPHLEGGAA